MANDTQTDDTDGAAQPAAKKVRRRSASYPRYTMREAEELAREVFDLGARHVDQDRLARALGYSGVKNGSYKSRRASANYFEMVDYQGLDYIEVREPWQQAFHSEDPENLRQARAEAFGKPELYGQLLAEFEGKMLPRKEKLARHLYLHDRFGIRQDAAMDAAGTFLESAAYAGFLDNHGFLRPPGERSTAPEGPSTRPADGGDTVVFSDSARVEVEHSHSGGDRLEIRLAGGRKVFLTVPPPGTLSLQDKERVKGFVDLVLEPEEGED